MKIVMQKDLRKISVLVSLLIHTTVLAIPISFSVKKFSKEVEIYILDERPLLNTKAKEKKLSKETLPTKKLEEQKPQSQIEVKKEESSETKVVETPEIEKKEEGKVLVEANHTQTTSSATTSSSKVASTMSKGDEEGRHIIEGVEVGSAQGPKFLHREIPQYPLIARRLGKEGVVRLMLTIDEKGKLLNIEVLEGAGYGFTEAAIEAVKKSTFIPAYKNGKPIMCKALLTIRFVLRREQ
ncbi:MAG: energy transducer TonB [Caldimicrobium sp.]